MRWALVEVSPTPRGSCSSQSTSAAQPAELRAYDAEQRVLVLAQEEVPARKHVRILVLHRVLAPRGQALGWHEGIVFAAHGDDRAGERLARRGLIGLDDRHIGSHGRKHDLHQAGMRENLRRGTAEPTELPGELVVGQGVEPPLAIDQVWRPRAGHDERHRRRRIGHGQRASELKRHQAPEAVPEQRVRPVQEGLHLIDEKGNQRPHTIDWSLPKARQAAGELDREDLKRRQRIAPSGERNMAAACVWEAEEPRIGGRIRPR